MSVDMHRSEIAKSLLLANQVVVGVVVGCAPDHQTDEGTSGGEQNEGRGRGPRYGSADAARVMATQRVRKVFGESEAVGEM